MINEDQFNKFCKQYGIRVEDSNRVHSYLKPMHQFFQYPDRADLINQMQAEHHTEKLYTISIPESRLRSLIDMEDRFYRFSSRPGNRELFDVLMDKEREEAMFRSQNEGVQKAYEQYSILLHLAGYERKF